MHPTDILSQEHRAIESMLDALETQIRQAKSGGPFPRLFCDDALDFFRNFADGCHHAKEENLLFPRMRERGVPQYGGPIGVMLAALLSSPKLRFSAFYRTAIFVPTVLSFVIVGFAWKLILSPLWGVAPNLLDLVGLKFLFSPWLGKEGSALIALSLVSVWQFVGIPMMLIYAALLSIPDEVIEAAECDGVTGMAQFWKIKLPLILPAIGIISILTFVGNFNAFDLIYTVQGALAGPDGSTDILGTLLYRTFFGFQLQLGDRSMGATIATVMFLIILAGVSFYLFAFQRRMRRYQF